MARNPKAIGRALAPKEVPGSVTELRQRRPKVRQNGFIRNDLGSFKKSQHVAAQSVIGAFVEVNSSPKAST